MKIRFIFSLIAITFAGCASGNRGVGYSGHGAESVSAEDLARFAPPELPKDLRARVESLLDLRSPGPGYLTQNQKRMFFEWSVSGTPQVWRMDGAKSFPIQMTGGANATEIEGITPDGRWLILGRDESGDEYTGLYVQSADGGLLRTLFQKPKVRASLNLILDDSQTAIISANDIDPESFAIHKVRIDNGQFETLHQAGGAWVAVDEKNGVLLLRKLVTNVASEFYELDLAKKELKPLLGQNEKEDYAVMFGPRTGEYLVLTAKFGDHKRLYSMQDRKFTPVSMETNWDVESFSIDRSRKRIVYTINEHGYSRLHAIDAKTRKTLPVPQFPGADQVRLNQITHNGRTLSVSVSYYNRPRMTFTWSWDAPSAKQWILPSQPETDAGEFVKAELEAYTARDGVQIPMFVRRPKKCEPSAATSPCPVIIHFHGGPEAQSRPGYSLMAQLFIEEGFIYVEPNVRGSSGYGRKWLDSDNGPKRLDVVTDIADAASFIRKNWAVRGVPPRIGVMGGSYGGYSTLYAMTRFAGSYEAGVASVGMSNLTTFLVNTAPYRRALRTPEYGDPEKDQEALKQLSPVTYIERISGPLLMLQGVTDPRVPAGESIQFFEMAHQKKTNTQLILFADEGHGIAKRSNQVLSLGHTLMFFKKHLN